MEAFSWSLHSKVNIVHLKSKQYICKSKKYILKANKYVTYQLVISAMRIKVKQYKGDRVRGECGVIFFLIKGGHRQAVWLGDIWAEIWSRLWHDQRKGYF